MRTCVFAGTFDPFTTGHEYVVNKCLETFEKVIIAVGVNVDKKPLFTLEQRKQIINAVYKNDSRIEVLSYDGMLVDFMKEKGVKVTVRGIRNEEDYKYETTMSRFNQDMYSDCITMFIPTPTNLTYVSSSAIRNILSLKGDISTYVPKNAIELISSFTNQK